MAAPGRRMQLVGAQRFVGCITLPPWAARLHPACARRRQGRRPRRSSLARNAFHLVLGQARTMVLGILFSAALGRTLGAGDFGLYFLVSSFSAFALVVVDWGQQFFGIREVARARRRGGESCSGTGLVLRGVGDGPGLRSPPAERLGPGLRPADHLVRGGLRGAQHAPLPGSELRDRLPRARPDGARRHRLGHQPGGGPGPRAARARRSGSDCGGVVVAQGLAGLAALLVAGWLYRQVAHGPAPLLAAPPPGRSSPAARRIVTMTLAANVQPYIDAVLLSKLVPKDAVGWYGAAKSIMGTLLAPVAHPRRGGLPPALPGRRQPGSVSPGGHHRAAADGLAGRAGRGGNLALRRRRDPRGLRAPGTSDRRGIILSVFGLGLFLVFIDVLLGTALTALGRATAFSVVKIGSVVLATGLELLLIPCFQRLPGNGGLGW